MNTPPTTCTTQTCTKRSTLARVWLAISLGLCACVELPDFDAPSVIDRPRVLAVVAEPPEINPGEPVTMSVLVAGTDGDYDVAWRACAAFDDTGNTSQYGDLEPDEGCGGGGFGVDLGEGDTLTVPGALTASAFDDLELAEEVLGELLPKGAIEAVRARVGLPLLIEARVTTASGKTLRAIKRVLLSEREETNTNPPPPSFELSGQVVVADEAAAFSCRGADGRAPYVGSRELVALTPLVLGDEEPWLEDYEVIDASGAIQARRERAFYSWFSTGGRFDQEVTKSPLRNELWRAPREVGCYPLWVVVRDGHGGTSACQVEVAVGDEQACGEVR